MIFTPPLSQTVTLSQTPPSLSVTYFIMYFILYYIIIIILYYIMDGPTESALQQPKQQMRNAVSKGPPLTYFRFAGDKY